MRSPHLHASLYVMQRSQYVIGAQITDAVLCSLLQDCYGNAGPMCTSQEMGHLL